MPHTIVRMNASGHAETIEVERLDEVPFDRFARALAGGRSRRAVLAGLAGGLAALVGGGRATLADHRPDHCAHEGEKEHLNRNHPKPCCAGLIADSDGRCVPDVPTCLPPGAFCDQSNFQDCCSLGCLLTDPSGPVNKCL